MPKRDNNDDGRRRLSLNDDHISPADWLRAELTERQATNPSYSMRALARKIGLTSGHLSLLLSKKRSLTTALGDKIAERLAYSEDRRQRFLSLIEASRARARSHVVSLEDTRFTSLASWHHFAILSLARTAGFRPDDAWVAARLGIEQSVAAEGLAHLRSLGLLEPPKDDIPPVPGPVMAVDRTWSAPVREHLTQSIDRTTSVLAAPSDGRHQCLLSLTLPLAKDAFEEATSRIQALRTSLARLSQGKTGHEVYVLNLQLQQVSKPVAEPA